MFKHIKKVFSLIAIVSLVFVAACDQMAGNKQQKKGASKTVDATKKAETISKEGVKRVEQHKKDAENALKTILKEIETLSTEVDGIHGIIKDILKTPPVYKGSKPPSPPSAPKTVKKTVPSRPTPVMPKKSVSTRPKMVTPTGKILGGAKMVGGMRKYGKKY